VPHVVIGKLTVTFTSFGLATLLVFAVQARSLSQTTNAATPQPTITVPRDTVIPVLVTKQVMVGGFGDARESKKVEFEVEQDIIQDGFFVAKKGDLVEGHFTTEKNVTKRVFSENVSQELSLDIDDIVNYCGDTLHMKYERTFVGGGRAGVLSFGPHAHDAVFQKGLILQASTDRLSKGICAEPTDKTQAPYPDNMLVPDDQLSQ
jgi:hypothetical protein